MRMEKRRVYTAECKREAVRLVTDHGYGVGEAARHLGLKANMVGRWKRQHEAQTTGAFPGNSVPIGGDRPASPVQGVVWPRM